MGDGCDALDEAIRNGGRERVAPVGPRARRDRVAFQDTQLTACTVRGRSTRAIGKIARCMMSRIDDWGRLRGEQKKKGAMMPDEVMVTPDRQKGPLRTLSLPPLYCTITATQKDRYAKKIEMITTGPWLLLVA